jgi:hypothetical protein
VASKLGPQAEDLAPGPAWHAIRALGNVLRHAYDQVHPGRLWEIATKDLASLAEAVDQATERLEKASSPSELGKGRGQADGDGLPDGQSHSGVKQASNSNC